VSKINVPKKNRSSFPVRTIRFPSSPIPLALSYPLLAVLLPIAPAPKVIKVFRDARLLTFAFD
jgi:hypothetical protein